MTSHSVAAPRLPCLDGLRTFAVLLIILFHQFVLPIGWIGVQVFFVISGYLITRLLFEARDSPFALYLRDFYARRSRRIFPLYFAVIGALWLVVRSGVGLAGVAEGLPYAATYTYNVWHASSDFVHSKYLTHFWSLCVEEQFYLVWPLLVYLSPAARIGRVLIGLVLLGPVVRGILYALLLHGGLPVMEKPDVALYVLMPTHVDAFAIGGYFALFPLGGARRALAACFAALVAAGAGVVLLATPGSSSYPATWACLGFPLGMGAGYAMIWGFSLMNLCSVLLIDCIVHRKFLPGLFDFPPIRYLGRISYGIYVFHYPVQSILARAVPSAIPAEQIAMQLAITIALASFSFHFWEARFMHVKDLWFPGASRALPRGDAS